MLGTAFALLLGLTAAATLALAGYAWRYRLEPGARPFAWLMVAVGVWTACSGATLLTGHPTVHRFFERLQYLGIAFVPVPWLLFVLEYSGYDEFVSREFAALLSVVPLLTVAFVWTNPGDVFFTSADVVVRNGVPVELHAYGPWFYVNLVYAYTLIGISTLLIVRLVVLSDYLFADQSALLVLGSTVPLVGNALSVFGFVPIQGIDLTPFSFAVTGFAFGYALFRHRLFDLVPATRRLGRNAAIADLEDGVVILDTDDRVVYCNDAAGEVLEASPRETLGRPVSSFLDPEAVAFDAPDALGELETGDRVYEVRSSPITDRNDRTIGTTLVFNDVTTRKRQQRRLRQQRDRLERLERINELVRGVNRVLVGANTREEIERAVCDRLADGDLYEGAWIAGGSTERVIGRYATDGGDDPGMEVQGAPITWSGGEDAPPDRLEDVEAELPGLPEGYDWTLVPLSFGHTVYGGLVLASSRPDAFEDREIGVLDELGQTIGHAINAVESRRTLLADAVTELEFRAPESPVATLAAEADCELRLEGVVPGNDDELLVYLRVDGDPGATLAAAESSPSLEGPRLVEDDGNDAVLECSVTGESPLVPLSEGGVNLQSAVADPDGHRVVVETVPEADVRAIVERVQAVCPGAELAARRERDRPTDTDGAVPSSLEELTTRQREALEAAYRAGYFEWPRQATAEDVAERMDISSPTLHNHLRKAEGKLLAEFYGE